MRNEEGSGKGGVVVFVARPPTAACGLAAAADAAVNDNAAVAVATSMMLRQSRVRSEGSSRNWAEGGGPVGCIRGGRISPSPFPKSPWTPEGPSWGVGTGTWDGDGEQNEFCHKVTTCLTLMALWGHSPLDQGSRVLQWAVCPPSQHCILKSYTHIVLSHPLAGLRAGTHGCSWHQRDMSS